MISVNFRSLLALPLLLVLAGPVQSREAARIGWPDAVAQLTAQRTRAEACVVGLKKYGNQEQIAQGQLSYAKAKADTDAVIAGLITALSAGQEPASLSSLQSSMSSGVSGLAEFCNRVSKLLPGTTAGQKGLESLAAIALSPEVIKQALTMLTAGVSALYNDHRADDALTRATIKTQLEAARWPAFSEVKAAE